MIVERRRRPTRLALDHIDPGDKRERFGNFDKPDEVLTQASSTD
jgi:hypothetical protein